MLKKLPGLAALAATSALAITAATAAPATAQSADELKAELAALKAKMAEIEKRLQKTEEEQKKHDLKVEAKGAPQFSGIGFKNFKLRGRIQTDVGIVGDPDRIGTGSAMNFSPDNGLGTTTEFRRARLGVEGEIADWAYKAEFDFADNKVSAKDVLLEYKGIDGIKLTLGHQKTGVSAGEETSSRFVPFMERAAFNSAFGFDRELGASVSSHGATWGVKAGIYATGALSGNDEENGYALAGRAFNRFDVGGGFIQLGGSLEFRDKSGAISRFRARPFLHTTDTRFVDTGTVDVSDSLFYGGEILAQRGPVSFTGEYGRLRANRPGGLANASFQGGYAQLGWILTGESRGYKKSEGIWDRTKPAQPLGKGGFGALELNLGIDWVDLTDNRAGIAGGNQYAVLAGFTWIPVSHVRFLVNYGRVKVDTSPTRVKLGSDGTLTRSFSTNAFGIRGQIDW
ncbi:MAG: hypothetical protein KatS3mg119_1127 [Rhodothalassiaceae bacterium]|nr:MAG: hypothetical protein KatS3mg119_1127 [Rhodothalassiaceae bacterium]